MNLCWITASFPYSTLGMVLWNVAWEEEDYAYWEIIWNHRLGLSSFGIMLSKDGWVVEREDERWCGENLPGDREMEISFYLFIYFLNIFFLMPMAYTIFSFSFL